MAKSKLGSWFILGVPLMAVLAVVGFRNGKNQDNRDGHGVSLQPPMIEFKEPVIEGESLTATFELVNLSSGDFQVEDVRGSCSCLGIKVDGKDWFKTTDKPVLVPKGKVIIEVQWSTIGRHGANQQAVVVMGKQGTKHVELQGTISGYILSGPRVVPPTIVVGADSRDQRYHLDILSGSKLPDYTIISIRPSDPELIIGTHLESVEPKKISEDFFQNFELSFNTTGDEAFKRPAREFIEISLERRGQESSIQIPVIFERREAPPLKLFPNVMVIPKGSVGSLTSTVVCVGQCSGWRIGSMPVFITEGRLEERGDSTVLLLEYDTRSIGRELSTTDVVLVNGDNAHSLKILVEGNGN